MVIGGTGGKACRHSVVTNRRPSLSRGARRRTARRTADARYHRLARHCASMPAAGVRASGTLNRVCKRVSVCEKNPATFSSRYQRCVQPKLDTDCSACATGKPDVGIQAALSFGQSLCFRGFGGSVRRCAWALKHIFAHDFQGRTKLGLLCAEMHNADISIGRRAA